MDYPTIIATILVCVILLFWYMHMTHPVYTEMWLDDVLKLCKTGDLIIFKAQNNLNSLFIGNYYTHVGVVWVPSDGQPMLFEAAGCKGMALRDPETNGIFCNLLRPRLLKYKGKCFIKRLNNSVNEYYDHEFSKFIDFCKSNMYYDMSVHQTALNLGLGYSKIGINTNCGELAFLSLIRLGILDPKKYTHSTFHYLKWISNLEKADNGYCYIEPIEIVDDPFTP